MCNVSLVDHLNGSSACSHRTVGCSAPTVMWVTEGCRGIFRCGAGGRVKCGHPLKSLSASGQRSYHTPSKVRMDCGCQPPKGQDHALAKVSAPQDQPRHYQGMTSMTLENTGLIHPLTLTVSGNLSIAETCERLRGLRLTPRMNAPCIQRCLRGRRIAMLGDSITR